MQNQGGGGSSVSYQDKKNNDEMVGYILRKLHEDFNIALNYEKIAFILNAIKEFEKGNY